MRRTARAVSVRVVEAGPERRAEVERMLATYLRELARFEPGAAPPEPHDHPWLPLYWEEPGRHPFLVVENGEVAGFALVRRVDAGADVSSVLAEFYVAPAHRRRGVGRAAALEVLRRFPGSWRVRRLSGNAPAAAFWGRVLAEAARDGVRERAAEGGAAVVAELVVPPRRTSGTR